MSASASAWPTRPQIRVRTYGITLALVAFTVFAARKVGFSPSTFWEVWSNPLWEKFWPIPWEWVLDGDTVIKPLIETFQIAVLSTIIGCSLALPISFAMSPLTTPNRPTYLVSRAVMNVVRAVPDRSGPSTAPDNFSPRSCTIELQVCAAAHMVGDAAQ